VVVDIVRAAIDVREESDRLPVPFVLNVEEVAGDKVEGCCVKGNHILEVLDAKAKVTQLYLSVIVSGWSGETYFVDGCRARNEALEVADARLVGLVVDDELGRIFAWCCW
jgi:hypothetical protein